MYIRVKKDSVTSIILFICNVFLVERDINSIPLKKIFKLLEPFDKSETSIRMGLSRGVQNGLFVNEKRGQEVYYRLTKEAMQSFDYWHKTLTRFQERVKIQYANWDGHWSIVLLLLPSRKKPLDVIECFAELLGQLGYAAFNKNQWVSPYDFSKEITEMAQEQALIKDLVMFHGSLKNKEPKEIASELWPVKKLALRYKKYVTDVKKSAGKLDLESPGDILTFLYLHGAELFEIIQDDPQLPLELLPHDWHGPAAAQIFREIRQQILPKANIFIDQVLND